MSITLTRKTLFLIHRLHWYCTIMDATANCGCCKYVVCALMFFSFFIVRTIPYSATVTSLVLDRDQKITLVGIFLL